MNYLAHIHLAALTNTSLLGNFLGDFIKGKELSHLPEDIQLGIWLHRRIDSFTDSHQDIKSLKRQFPKPLQRVSGICIDVWFDYLLMQQNSEFPPDLDGPLLDNFYIQLHRFQMTSEHKSEGFCRIRDSLLRDRWLIHYQNRETCLRAFKSIERRLRNKILFADESFEFMEQQQSLLEDTFNRFYAELMGYSRSVITSRLESR